MSKRLTQERRNEIAKKLVADGKINAPWLAREYGVSAETIRKDLIYLEKNGIAKKAYGGAVVSTELIEANFSEKAVENQEEKALIAKKAAEMVSDADTVLLDSGSTVMAIAKQLVLKKDLTIFTNSLKTAQLLSDYNIKTYLLGGEIRNTSNAVTGQWAVRALKEIKVNLAFIGTSGFCGREGPCVESFPEGDVKKAMIAAAYRAVVVADSAKSKCDAMIEFERWGKISILITDGKIDARALHALRQKTRVVIA